ncbi:MAG: guanylate kinase [Flaviflexus sp.]|nr:guanylate kinase [Flaviflexus sp.]
MSTPAFVVCGPTAVGKDTLIRRMRGLEPRIWLSISATTRDPRPGEVDGVDYYFVTQSRFDELIASGDMLEWAVVHGVHRYGTPRQPVTEALDRGDIALLEVDLAGARQVRQSMPEATQIFIAPPAFEDLARRLAARGTEGPEERQRRLETAKVELAAADEFDHVVVNDDVARATDELLSIIRSMG